MIITKKWTVFLIFSIATILAISFLTHEKKSTLNLKQEPVKEQRLLQNNTEILEDEIQDSDSSIVQENLTKEKVSDSTPPTLIKNTQIMDIHQQRQNDPTITLKLSDFSPEEQALQKKWLTSYNENGYIQTSEVSFDYIKSQNELIELVVPDASKMIIPLQEVSTTQLSEYEYLGQVLDMEKTDKEPNSLHSEITRAYRGDDGQEVFLLEKSVQNTKAILVEEFVTENINGYPASRMTFCTENQRCMSKITLITKDKLYEVSTYGDQDSTKDKLIKIISSFDLPELKTQ